MFHWTTSLNRLRMHIGPSIFTLTTLLLTTASARAEGLGPAGPNSDRRVYGVQTLMPTSQGVIAIGGPSLRRLAPGARRWETLHTVPDDHSYRVAADEAGRLLVAWSKESIIHFVSTSTNQHEMYPKPEAPSGVSNFEISDLAFSPDGRDAVVFMTGSVRVTASRWTGSSPITSVFRIPLEGIAPNAPLFRVDHAYRFHDSGKGGVFGMPNTIGQQCSGHDCYISSIFAYEISARGAIRKTLFDASASPLKRVRAVRSNDSQRVVLILDEGQPRPPRLLTWRYGDAQVSLRNVPSIQNNDQTKFYLTRDDALLELRVRDGLLEIWRHPVQGEAMMMANLGELQDVDTGLYGVGERADGTLWLHYGDHLGLLSANRPPRAYSLKSLLPRRSEWTLDIYVSSPEQLWIGIDDTGRHFVRADFSVADRRATPWRPGAPVERAHGEDVGRDVRDASNGDRLLNATTLRPMTGGLFSLGGPSLRRFQYGSRRWQTLHTIQGDSLYRATADANGRILAAWEKDPSIHLFDHEQHIALPRPTPRVQGMGDSHVEHLAFLPNGRDAMVVISGQVRSPPSRTVPEPVRFYYSSWATEAYRIALDGRSPPVLLFRDDYAYSLYEGQSMLVFAMPKYPGQQCTHETCMPMTAIVAYEITDNGIRKTTLIDQNEMTEGVYLSQAALVRGSDDEHLAIVVSMTGHPGGNRWTNGGRVLLRWRRGESRGRVSPLPGWSGITPIWLLTRGDDFIELLHHYDRNPEHIELKRYAAHGGESSIKLPMLRKMQSPLGLGERADGGLWLQWGDHLGLLTTDGHARSIDLDQILQRGTEWAGAAMYISSPESLWVGLDGRGRSYVRVDIATAERRARQWQAISTHP